MSTRLTAIHPLRVSVPLAVVLLCGCAGQPREPVPERIAAPPPGDLQLVEVRQDPQAHVGAPVRWGGTVIGSGRDADGNVRVQVVERRLDDAGRPLPGSPSDGRFVIRAAPDVNPDLYARGNDVTVAGTLDTPVDARVGDGTARLPVVRVEAFMLWGPYWRTDPWYPYGHGVWFPYGHGAPWYGPYRHFGPGHLPPHLHHPHGWW